MLRNVLFKTLGLLFVCLAILGVFLPLLPTTPFLLVAAACFAKSSPRLYKALIENKVFGPIIIHWRRSRTIPKKAKYIALLTMLSISGLSLIVLEGVYLKLFLICLMILPIIYIARLPITTNI